MTDPRPRGIRNNNPGNIRKGPTQWEGLAPPAQQTDPAFLVFATAAYGVRAIARILRSYRERSGCDTIRKVFNRWAPPVENNTAAYIADVAQRCGIGPDVRLPALLDTNIVLALVKAIIQHENGCQPYLEQTLLTGIKLAGVAPPPTPAAPATAVQTALVSEIAA